MIKLLDILENKILVPRRSAEERSANFLIGSGLGLSFLARER